MARFLSLDPLAAEFPAWSDYNYVLGNPVMFIDPDGKAPLHTLVLKNEDGTYTVQGGNPNDGDNGIYVQNSDGTKGEKIGESVTSHSFFRENGKAVKGAVINLSSTEGKDFLEKIIDDDPNIISYAYNASCSRFKNNNI